MSVSEATFTALRDMGIDPVLAREAASRYHNIEPAVNWCFGDGMSWTPEAPKPEPIPLYSAPYRPRGNEAEGTSVEHREVIDVDTPPISQPSPTRAYHDALHKPFASNNPFRTSHSPNAPPLPLRRTVPSPSPTPTTIDDDEELRKALELSTAEIGETPEDEERRQRERSLRANGPPPPSPEGEPIESIGPLFGPSNKTNEEGKLAMVPAGQDQPSMSKEDEELNRAIQESLMTASFHSASAAKDTDRPKPAERPDGAPLVFYSESGRSTYAANFVQAMYAVPQLREAISTALSTSSTDKSKQLVRLLNTWTDDRSSFVNVDEALKILRDGNEPNQLPPNRPVLDIHGVIVNELGQYAGATNMQNTEEPQSSSSLERLMYTEVDVNDGPPQHSSHVTFSRNRATAPNIYAHLADILWGNASMGQGLVELGDVLTVFVSWDHGASREIWDLHERVVLDRFMKSNAAYAAQKRAHQSVMAGNARRVQEKINSLTTHEGNDYHQSISALIEHLETSPLSDDAMQNESRAEMKAKLQKVLKVLQSKVDEYKLELEENSKAASAGAFDTDDPELNRHVYTLRGILFTDGALVGTNHLYAYVRQDDGVWWKVQDHDAIRVEWDTIVADKTGLWMEGGPYTLIYSREGPRPAPATPEPQPGPEVQGQSETPSPAEQITIEDSSAGESNLIDITMSEPTPTATPPNEDSMDKDTGTDKGTDATTGSTTVASQQEKSAADPEEQSQGTGKEEQEQDLLL